MVTIIAHIQGQTQDGKVFNKLQLQGGAEAVQSQNSGRFYLTARTCSISTTFDEETCKRLVGTTLKGTVIKVETDSYAYTVPETGEAITLNHRWEYQPFDLNQEKKEAFDPREMVMG